MIGNLGNIGDPNTLARLFCELHSYGKTIIRQGWRQGLPQDKPPIWVFCPLMKKSFPRDRILISECEKCSHYKGVSHSLRQSTSTKDAMSFNVHMIPAKRKQSRTSFTKEQLEKEEKELREKERIWKNDEEKKDEK
jgi:hypothetical protein